jgi:hypothetical protein
MKHAIAANLCPFCGRSIFSANELALRKSIERVLIKNGLDKDEVINRIVDDIIALANGSVEPQTTTHAAAPVAQAAPSGPRPRSAEDRDKVSPPRPVSNERGADGLTEAERNAPARVLTPGPRTIAQSQPARVGADAMSAAMRAFEEDNSDPMSQPYAEASQAAADDDDDASGIFFMEATASAMEAERRKGVAQAHQQERTIRIPEGQARTAPAFNRVS